MSDDHVILHVEVSVVLVYRSLVFFGNSVKKMCTSAPYSITMKTRILELKYILTFSKYK